MFCTTSRRCQRATEAIIAGILAATWITLPEGLRASSAEAVPIYLNIQKGDGLITGLQQANFRLYEDGEPKPFRLETPEAVGAIALLVEHSRSSGYYFEDLGAAMQGFLKHAPQGNWYSLATFSHGLEIRSDFTKQIGNIIQAYSSMGPPFWNEIDTYDAVYEMLDRMGKLPGRRVLIVIGSGLDSFSEKTLDQIKQKVDAENVVVFVAGAGSGLRGIYERFLGASARMSLLQASAFLQMLADRSGGCAWFPTHQSAFPDVMQGIMQSIATQYRLTYETNVRKSGRFHPIKVEAFRIVNDKRENFKVLVRDGWR